MTQATGAPGGAYGRGSRHSRSRSGRASAEALAGWLMWAQPRPGAWMGLALLPLEFVFWMGFALPYGPLLGLARTVAILAALVPLSRPAA